MTRLCITTVLLLVSFTSVAADKLRSKNYNCTELQQQLQSDGKLVLRGFLGSSTTVYATIPACPGLSEIPQVSHWRSKDKFSCRVGYRCIQKAETRG